jgi:histidyl-tRNA synthetase
MLDTVGASSPAADAEICMMMADVMEAIGIPRGDYVIRVNNRKVLDGVMEAIGLGGEENAGRRLHRAPQPSTSSTSSEARRVFVSASGRRPASDESGDFTPGAGLDEGDIGKITALDDPEVRRAVAGHGFSIQRSLGRHLRSRMFPKSGCIAPRCTIGRMDHDVERLRAWQRRGTDELYGTFRPVWYRAAGYGRWIGSAVDPSVVRGLEYYTSARSSKPNSLFETVNDKGEKARYGSVAGGGRYDGLVARFGGQAVPATGLLAGSEPAHGRAQGARQAGRGHLTPAPSSSP